MLFPSNATFRALPTQTVQSRWPFLLPLPLPLLLPLPLPLPLLLPLSLLLPLPLPLPFCLSSRRDLLLLLLFWLSFRAQRGTCFSLAQRAPVSS
jgi:hypothetical protein